MLMMIVKLRGTIIFSPQQWMGQGATEGFMVELSTTRERGVGVGVGITTVILG